MTINEIKELKELGFTPDQIISLNGSSQVAPEEEQPAPAEAPAEALAEAPAEEQPAPESQDNKRLEQLEQTVKDQNDKISNLIKLVQASNRQNMSMDSKPDGDLMKKTDEVMAELIRPTK